MITTQYIEKIGQQFHNNFTHNHVVLYAGANIPSEKMLRLMGTTLGSMPAMGYGPSKVQPGVTEISELEIITETLAMELFHGDWAEVKFPSCTLANLAIYLSVCSPGDTIAVTPAYAGGHVSHQAHGAPAFNGLQVIELAFDNLKQIPDDQRSAELIRQHRPRLLMLGASYTPFSYPFEQMLAAAREVQATVVYDVAHVAGLIAAGNFPNPLDAGADLITMSTYKSLGGPAGGMIIGKNHSAELKDLLRAAAYPKMLANYDASRVAALAVALADMRDYGKAYAQEMCQNATALKHALRETGLEVLETATHHLTLPFAQPEHVSRLLEKVGIITGTTSVAGQTHTHALRLGTQLVTRRGMNSDDMKTLARLIHRAISGDDPMQLSEDVSEFAQSFTSLHFVST